MPKETGHFVQPRTTRTRMQIVVTAELSATRAPTSTNTVRHSSKGMQRATSVGGTDTDDLRITSGICFESNVRHVAGYYDVWICSHQNRAFPKKNARSFLTYLLGFAACS